MGTLSVAMIVESSAPRKTPNQITPMVIARRLVDISSGIMTCSVEVDCSLEGLIVAPRRGARSSASWAVPFVEWLSVAIVKL